MFFTFFFFYFYFFFSSRRRHTISCLFSWALRCVFFFFQAEDGIRDRSPSRGLGDVYKRQYQLSNAYKELGQIYDQNGLKQKALDAYREGLRLNSGLSVKKRIKQLEKELNA